MIIEFELNIPWILGVWCCGSDCTGSSINVDDIHGDSVAILEDIVEVVVGECRAEGPAYGKIAGTFGIAICASTGLFGDIPGATFVHKAVVYVGGCIVDFGDFVAVGRLGSGGVDGVTIAVFQGDGAWSWDRAEESSFGISF